MTTPFTYRDKYISDLLMSTWSIALIGASANESKTSNDVMGYLLSLGYHVTLVNPFTSSKSIHGQTVYPTIKDIPHPIDMVDVFRPKSEFMEHAQSAIDIGVKSIWGQLDIFDLDAAEMAMTKGLKVVMDRCPKIEISRLIASRKINFDHLS